MADEADSGDKTEEATPERREEFRGRGEIAHSREFTTVAVMAAAVSVITFAAPDIMRQLQLLFAILFESASSLRINEDNVLTVINDIWLKFLRVIIPVFMITMAIAVFSTFSQTKLNVSFKRMKPSLQKFSILQGLKRMVSGQSLMELTKGIGKMASVGLVAYLILRSEFTNVPSILYFSIPDILDYWGEITMYLFWSVAGLLLLISGADYIYNHLTLEKKMKMSKHEVKEEFKKREVDPLVKGKMKRMQREAANRQMIRGAREATVIVTNPTHYAVALKYEIGMAAPIVLAKGIDFLALRMREAAKESEVPIVENKPLARTIYKLIDVGEEIPESLYKAVSEVIRYVFSMRKNKAAS